MSTHHAGSTLSDVQCCWHSFHVLSFSFQFHSWMSSDSFHSFISCSTIPFSCHVTPSHWFISWLISINPSHWFISCQYLSCPFLSHHVISCHSMPFHTCVSMDICTSIHVACLSVDILVYLCKSMLSVYTYALRVLARAVVCPLKLGSCMFVVLCVSNVQQKTRQLWVLGAGPVASHRHCKRKQQTNCCRFCMRGCVKMRSITVHRLCIWCFIYHTLVTFEKVCPPRPLMQEACNLL